MLSKRKIKGESKENQSALRHKVRNLRAKVRLLLPMELCCKQQKRSKNLIKMSFSKAMQQQQKQKRWCNCRQDSGQLFIPHEEGRQQKHLFHKLTNDEIEQIKEDKMYYLGEQFISQFDSFLQSKEKTPHTKLNILESNITSKNPIMSIQEVAKRNWNWHKNSSSQMGNYIGHEKQNKIDWHIRQVIKFEGIKEKRKQITEDDLTKRVFVKMRLKEKEQRMKINHQKALFSKIQIIKSKNKQIESRSCQSLRLKRNDQQLGEITDLSEKLRDVYLSRYSKSANLLFRS